MIFVKVTYHGHSVVYIETKAGNIVVDPFLTGNGQCHVKPEDLSVDYIVLTHGHNDHVGDTIELAKKNDALVIAVNELADYLASKGLKTHGMSIGGGYNFDFGRVKYTQAFHGSSYETEEGQLIYTGMPGGVLLTIEGQTIYHLGDTGLFSDLKLIGERNDIDLAFVPIGDNFTMGPEDATVAAEWIKAKQVVPVHYNTFPVIEQDPEQFVKSIGSQGKLLLSGETIEL